jgi:hypothetical protein
LPLVLARSLGTRSLRVSALRFQRGSCRPRKPASRVCCRHKRTPREFFRRYGQCNTPQLLSDDLLEMRVGDETRAPGRERPGDAKVACLALAIAERPATPDPRIRTIVRSLIQEATSAVRPKMIAGRAWRPTWPSIDPRTQRCRSHVHDRGRRWGRARRKRQGEHGRPLWATDRVRHLPVVAPSMRSSNTGGATPSGGKASSPPLFDDGAALRRPDGDPRPRPMEKDRCHSTEV